jgi:hypothetical protein
MQTNKSFFYVNELPFLRRARLRNPSITHFQHEHNTIIRSQSESERNFKEGVLILVNYSYSTRMYSCVTRMYSCVARMLLVCTRMLLVCYLYVLVCYSYVPVCYSYVLVCYSYVLVCYSYVTRMYSCGV